MVNALPRGAYVRQRALEMAAPALVWLAITAPVWASLWFPEALGFFLVFFGAYWLFKSFSFAAGVVIGYVRLQRWEQRDWAGLASQVPGYDGVRHLVFIPSYRESEKILADTLHHLAQQRVPLERVSVVLAFEERDPEAPLRAAYLQRRFGSLFGQLLVTYHPDLPGEVKGKAANLAWAARQVREQLLDAGALDPRHLLLTVCDADSRLHPGYLAALSHQYLTQPGARYHLFQPAVLFYANHWRLPIPLRAMNSMFSLWGLAKMVWTYRLSTVSTYSLSWIAASRMGFWDVDVIPEDSRTHFKALFALGRRMKVRPIFLPVYADGAEGRSLKGTLVNHFHQVSRWAWGISEVPYIARGVLRARHVPLHRRLAHAAWYVEEHLLWPSHWFLLTLGGWLPALLNPRYAASDLAVWQAQLFSLFLGFCFPCLVVVILVDWRLRPRHPEGEDVLDTLLGWGAFALMPLISLPLSTIPALQAHTWLLLGKRMEFRVTEKVPIKVQFRSLGQPVAPLPALAQERSAAAATVVQSRTER